MSKVTFTQSTTPDGQIAVILSSDDLPVGGFTFSLGFDYLGTGVGFDEVDYSGGSSVMTSASSIGAVGSVSLRGSLSPFGTQFATILFDAAGKGNFDLNITHFQINGTLVNFTDPASYAYSIAGTSISLPAGGFANGTYKPLDGFFGMSYGLKSAPSHGSVTFGEGSDPSTWKYIPATGFYGVDSFTLKVSDVFDTKEKTFVVNVSPVGTAANDSFRSSSGSYEIDGGSGIDMLTYSGKRDHFTVTKSGNSAIVTDQSGAEGSNHLDNFERLIFADGAIALDVDGNGGQAYRLYQAALNRTPDADGLGFWINALDQGLSLTAVADGFIQSDEFKKAYGSSPSNMELVTRFYENILQREPENAGLDFWVGVLDTKAASVQEVLVAISESAENQEGVATIIGNGFAYTPYGA